jgi:hypothetical protein
MMYRSPSLLASARGKDCTLQIPGVCNGNPETTVAAHANWQEYGKGGALKAHDIFHARACSACHAEIDQGKNLDYDEKKFYWQRGFERTVLALVQEGVLKVSRK